MGRKHRRLCMGDFFKLFLRGGREEGTERERERGRESQAGSMLNGESDVGTDPTNRETMT